jgi:hypothetical protein
MRSEDLWYIGYIAGVTPLLLISAIGWYKANKRVKKLEHQLLLTPVAEESQRIETTVEALAAQMNELANAQEFLQRMLLKKAEPPKATTPH